MKNLQYFLLLDKSSMAANFQSTSSLHLETIPDNHNLNNNFLLDSNNAEFVNTSAQTNQQTIKVKITLSNLKTYTQIESNSDIYSLVQVGGLKVNKNKGEHLAKSMNTESERNKDGESNSHQIAIRFRKRKEDPAFMAGLVDVLLEDFKLEIDVPTMNGKFKDFLFILNFL